MFEHWQKCPVLFQGGGDGLGRYDQDQDVIILNLDCKSNNQLVDMAGTTWRIETPYNPLIAYLYFLFVRDYPQKDDAWLVEQTVSLWTSMSTQERWNLGNMLFNAPNLEG